MSQEARSAAHTECRFTPAWQPGTDSNLQRAGKQPSAASPLEYPTLREQLEAALHNIDCLHVDEDENALDYYRAERAKGLLREALKELVR